MRNYYLPVTTTVAAAALSIGLAAQSPAPLRTLKGRRAR